MMLEVRDLHAFYGKSHILQGVDLYGRRGRDRQPARPQRRRPVDHVQGDHGPGRPGGTVRYRGRDIAGLRANLVAQGRHRLRAGGPPGLSHADRAPEPDARPEARRQVRALEFRRRVQAVPQSGGAAEQSGRRAVGRRAADADDVPHADGRSRPDPDRRTDRGPGADAGRTGRPTCWRRSPAAVCRSCWWSRS